MESTVNQIIVTAKARGINTRQLAAKTGIGYDVLRRMLARGRMRSDYLDRCLDVLDLSVVDDVAMQDSRIQHTLTVIRNEQEKLLHPTGPTPLELAVQAADMERDKMLFSECKAQLGPPPAAPADDAPAADLEAYQAAMAARRAELDRMMAERKAALA